MNNLRHRAEHLVDGLSERHKQLKSENPEKLIHELMVNQVELEMQNEELRQIQNELERSRDRFSLLYHQAPAGYITLDSSGLIIEANDTAVGMLPGDPGTVRNRAFADFICPEERALFLGRFKAFFKNPEMKSMELKLKSSKGSCIYVKVEGRTIGRSPQKEPGQLLLMLLDITEKKQLNIEREKALHQKEILFKEMNHRVKNNFTIISSIINLQKSTVPDARAREVLEDCSRRVLSMSYIHEQLCYTEEVQKIPFDSYLNRLLSDFRNAVRGSLVPDITVECGPVLLNIDKAVHCGLIVNEAVTNSLKYAFRKTAAVEKPEIRISVRPADENRLVLTIEDNGAGAPAETPEKAADSLGLNLIRILAEEQLSGTLQIRKSNGWMIQVTFRHTVSE